MTMQDPNHAAGVADPVFELRDTSVVFDMERGNSRVLDEVTLDVEREEILGVVGESGSGKSMFASALLDAVVDPGELSGRITYRPEDGDPVDLLALDEEELRRVRWEEVSMVFQGAMSSFNPVRTIRKHFVETLVDHEYDVEEGMDHAADLLEQLHLDPDRVLDSYPHELSGGMKQRALIALSLVLDPEVLVMDEPTAALDLLMQRSILALLHDLQAAYDLTVVFITHDLPLVAGLADRLAVMYAFEFVEIGPAETIVSGPSHPYTRALLNAVPTLDTPLTEMEAIEGASPDPVNPPQGCSYHPRCPLADDRCRTDDPGHYEVSGDHVAACHYWDRAGEAIPLAIDDAGSGDLEPTTSAEPTTAGEPVVSLRDLSVHFDREQGGLLNLFESPEVVHAVDDVTLDVYEEDVVALVGESGCGKTTLGRAAIAGQEPTSGSVEYRGQDVAAARADRDPEIPFSEIRRSLQMIHQDPGSALNPNRIVRSTLEMPLKRWHPGMSTEDRRARVLGMLEYVGMTPAEDYAERYPHQLSGGEQQRVALIRALLMNPDLILADEAVSALDVSLRVEMMDLMLDLQDSFGTSFLFISHNLSNARYVAANAGGRIGVMYLGEIVEIGPAEEVIRDPKHPYTQVLRWSTATLREERGAESPPVRSIDVPDPVDPPEGCRFHTRCPEAREVCTRERPTVSGDGTEGHVVACFRDQPDHEYWDSAPVEAESEAGAGAGGGGDGTDSPPTEADD